MNRITKNELRESFTTIKNEVINSDLSAQGLALYIYMASKPVDWRFNNSHLQKRFKWSAKTFKKYIDELVEFGLVLRQEQAKDSSSGKYTPCDYDILSKPLGKIPIGKNSHAKTVGKNSQLSNTNNTLIEQSYNFEQFWSEYQYKKGRSKCEKKFNQLTKKEKLKIQQTLPAYLSETCTTESKGSWKPMRKYPLTYLNQKIWEDYEDIAADKQDTTELTPEEKEGYKTYTDWLKQNHPDILTAIKYLSPAQYREYKKQVHGLGEGVKFRYLRESHEQWKADPALEVFDFFSLKIDEHRKEMAA